MTAVEYHVKDLSGRLIATHTDFAEAKKTWNNQLNAFYIDANWPPPFKHRSKSLDHSTAIIDYEAKLEIWRQEDEVNKYWNDQINRPRAAQPMKKDAINPDHYKEVIPGMQYMQLMEHLLKGFDGVEAHLLGQIYKYSMRLGKKDPKEQDSAKISWYAQCLADYYKTGKINVDFKA